ncbi:hypothetical protein Tco_0827826 [Tanacetum coccineum]
MPPQLPSPAATHLDTSLSSPPYHHLHLVIATLYLQLLTSATFHHHLPQLHDHTSSSPQSRLHNKGAFGLAGKPMRECLDEQKTYRGVFGWL